MRRTYAQLRAEFLTFHARNPEIYELVKERCYELIRLGRTHYAIATIWEVIRHHIDITTHSNIEDAEFKMPNNHRAFYARMFLDDHPQYQKFFEINHQRSMGPVPVDRFGREIDSEAEYDWAFT